jgi:hypothetical protein
MTDKEYQQYVDMIIEIRNQLFEISDTAIESDDQSPSSIQATHTAICMICLQLQEEAGYDEKTVSENWDTAALMLDKLKSGDNNPETGNGYLN